MIQPEAGVLEGDKGIGPAGAICVGPAPQSIERREFNPAMPRPAGTAVTLLLLDRHLDAASATSYMRSVERLETKEAVQHESQWRLPFDPQTQRVTIHSIKTIRAGVETEHAALERFRFIQREEGLEGQIIDGIYTALLVLEDVQRGDILDVSYSVQSRHRLFPNYNGFFYIFYDGTSVGDYCFSVKFDGNNPLAWTASDGNSPEEIRDSETVQWSWKGTNFTGPKAEPFTPTSEVHGSWVQVSSCRSWSEIIDGIVAGWQETPDDPRLLALVNQITSEEETLPGRVNRAIRIVQDDLRYLSVNLELGGQTPTACGTVLGRRYGDCKDLSFLLAQLLKGLGVEACPVLVDTKALRILPELLPSPNLFNHVVVEFVLEGERRWVDATTNRQGGGPLERAVADFGFGLPIRPGGDQLVAAPPSKQVDLYELREQIFLDTTGADSLLIAELRATGSHADAFRRQIDAEGDEKFGETLLEAWKNKYSRARRPTAMEITDDMERNEILLVETLEINDFLGASEHPGHVRFAVRDLLFLKCFALPDEEPRRTTWGLPYPLSIAYTLDVKSGSTGYAAPDRRTIANDYFEFHRLVSAGQGSWSFSFRMKTKRSSVPADKIDEYRSDLLEIYKTEMWHITAPAGVPRPRKRVDIGPPRRDAVAAEISEPSGQAIAAKPRMLQSGRPAVTPPPRRLAPSLELHSNRGNDQGIQRGKVVAPLGQEPPRRRRKKRKNRLWVRILIVVLLIIGAIAGLAIRYNWLGSQVQSSEQ